MLKDVFALSGVQLRTSKLLRRPEQVIRAKNVTTDKVGALMIRDGHTIIGAQITASKSSLSFLEFKYGSTPTRLPIVKLYDDIYVYTGGTWTAQSLSLTADARPRFAAYMDYLYAVELEKATRSFNGSAWSTSTNVTSAPQAKFVDIYKGRVVLANLKYGGTYYRDRFLPSELPDASNNVTWDFDNAYERVPIRNDDEITGVTVNGGYFIIYSMNTMFRYDGTFSAKNIVPISWQYGALNQEAIVTVENLTFAYSLQGVTVYAGGKPKLISRPIQDIIDRVDLSDYSAIVGGFDGDHVYFYVGTLTSALEGDAAALQKVRINYNIANDDWTYDVLPFAITCFGNYTSSGKLRCAVGTDDGKVLTANEGVNDDGTVINAEIIHEQHPVHAAYLATANFLYSYGYNLDEVSMTHRCDGGEWATAQTLVGNSRRKSIASDKDVTGRKFEFKFTGNRTTKQWRVEGYSLDHEVDELDTQE